jgi:hypothetical protein
MLIRDIFWLTKPKLVLLAIFLIILIPSYYNTGCPSGTCMQSAVCQCGFSIFNFYTAFVLSYLTSSILVELFNVFQKKFIKKVD